MKIVQIARFTKTGEYDGIKDANVFLSHINADDVIDVKHSTGEDYVDVMIIYKTEKDR